MLFMRSITALLFGALITLFFREIIFIKVIQSAVNVNIVTVVVVIGMSFLLYLALSWGDKESEINEPEIDMVRVPMAKLSPFPFEISTVKKLSELEIQETPRRAKRKRFWTVLANIAGAITIIVGIIQIYLWVKEFLFWLSNFK